MPGNSGSDIVTGLLFGPSVPHRLSSLFSVFVSPLHALSRQSKRTTPTRHSKGAQIENYNQLSSASSPTRARTRPLHQHRHRSAGDQSEARRSWCRGASNLLPNRPHSAVDLLRSEERRVEGNTLPRAMRAGSELDPSSTLKHTNALRRFEAEVTMHQHVRWRTPSAFRSCAAHREAQGARHEIPSRVISSAGFFSTLFLSVIGILRAC